MRRAKNGVHFWTPLRDAGSLSNPAPSHDHRRPCFPKKDAANSHTAPTIAAMTAVKRIARA